MFVQAGETRSSFANGVFRAMGREKSIFKYGTEENETQREEKKL
jgi:hypothetical protein